MREVEPHNDRELRRGVIDIVPEREFFERLSSGRKLRLKLGLDPSKPDLHIGHGVLLRKLRLLQEMGHQVVLIVGDWTAQIGDPSGQSATRPMLTTEEVHANAETYMRQFFHVVDKGKTEVRWQSEWFEAFSLADTIRLSSRFTVAQMLQREDFRTRYEAKKPLGLHEVLYPLLQAYDSVVIQADVEFGGTDQLFNLLVGRELQQEMGQLPQVCVTMRLLVGTDGTQKMSKSLGNTIDFEAPPSEKFGKVMSIPDAALLDYFELTTNIGEEELAHIRKQLAGRTVNPMEIKKRLAKEIVTQFHGEAAGREADAEWSRIFSDRELPSSVTSFVLPLSRPETSEFCEVVEGGATWSLPKVLVESQLANSMSEARRLLKAGAVELNGLVQRSPNASLKDGAMLRVGKYRFLQIHDATSVDSS